MKRLLLITAAICLGSVGAAVAQQSNPGSSTNTSNSAGASSTNSGTGSTNMATCDSWNLNAGDLADCRSRWSAAKTDSDRQDIKTRYESRGTMQGGSNRTGTTGRSTGATSGSSGTNSLTGGTSGSSAGSSGTSNSGSNR